MSFDPETQSHIRDKVSVVIDFSIKLLKSIKQY